MLCELLAEAVGCVVSLPGEVLAQHVYLIHARRVGGTS